MNNNNSIFRYRNKETIFFFCNDSGKVCFYLHLKTVLFFEWDKCPRKKFIIRYTFKSHKISTFLINIL